MLSEKATNISPAATIEISARIAELRRQGTNIISLNIGEPDYPTPENISQAAKSAIDAHFTKYQPVPGILELREAICKKFKTDNGLTYQPNEICVSAGAKQAVFNAVFVLCGEGDEVIIPTPAFGLYEQIVLMCRGVPVLMDTSQDGFQIRKQKLVQFVSDKTKAIIINTPNNPTGCIYDEESLAAVVDAIDGKNMFVICDDVYRQLIYTDDYHSFAERSEYRDQIIVVQSYSKPYAMTGWRMGYLMMPQSIKERLELIHQYVVVSTPAPFQKACMEALDCDVSAMRNTYEKRRAYVMDRLEKMGLSFTVPLGGFYVFPSIEKYGMTSDMFCRRLIEEAKLALTPGSCFGCEGHVRLTYCYEDGALKEGLDRLEGFLRKLEGTSL